MTRITGITEMNWMTRMTGTTMITGITEMN